jgi:hypothetical protein
MGRLVAGHCGVLASIHQVAAEKDGLLRRQPLAAFGPAIRQDTATADSGHPCPEPVPPLAHDLARLKGAFHNPTPF